MQNEKYINKQKFDNSEYNLYYLKEYKLIDLCVEIRKD